MNSDEREAGSRGVDPERLDLRQDWRERHGAIKARFWLLVMALAFVADALWIRLLPEAAADTMLGRGVQELDGVTRAQVLETLDALVATGMGLGALLAAAFFVSRSRPRACALAGVLALALLFVVETLIDPFFVSRRLLTKLVLLIACALAIRSSLRHE